MSAIEHKLTEANFFMQVRDYGSAIGILKEVLLVDPYNLTAIDTLFYVFYHQKEYKSAIDTITVAIDRLPDADRLSNRGLAHFEARHYNESLADYDAALALDPNHAIAHNNRGDTLKALGLYEESVEAFHKAINLNPNFAEPHSNLGVTLHDLGRFKEAEVEFNQAIAINPEYVDARFAKSFNTLKQGNYVEGFREFEIRWKSKAAALHQRDFKNPRWQGFEPLEGKCIYVYSEQGFGDSIQFARYIPMLASKGATVIVETEHRLVDLFTTLDGAAEVIVRGQVAENKVDYVIPIGSLPMAFGTSYETVPAPEKYLSADPVKVAAWEDRLGEKTQLRVGIAWSSFSQFQFDNLRSMSFEQFIKALPAGPEYICLQPMIKESDREALLLRNDITYVCESLTDFAETAALIECLDLVVSTCTSVPHLSAALGKPTWIMIPFSADWRWGVDTNDSVWYPTVQLFRQAEARNWNGVVHRVNEALTQYK